MNKKPKTLKGYRRLKAGTPEKRGDKFWNFSWLRWDVCGSTNFPFEIVGESVDNAPFVIRKVTRK